MNEPEILVLSGMALLAALGKSVELRKLSRSVSFRRIPSRNIREALLAVHLFAGFPAAIEGFAALAIAIPSGSRSKRASMSIIQTLERLDPELSDWIFEDGYGKVLSRSGLSLVKRKLIAVARDTST